MRTRPDRKIVLSRVFDQGWNLPLEDRLLLSVAPVVSSTGAIAVVPVAPAEIAPGETWSATLEITGTSARPIWAIASGFPDGLTLDARTGLLAWTPDASLAGTSHTVDVIARYGNSAQSVVRSQITLNVADERRANVAMAMPAILIQPARDYRVVEGGSIAFPIEIADTHITADRLRFELVGQVPDGASIDGRTGSFVWNTRPGDTTSLFTVRVWDSANPERFGTMQFPIRIDPVRVTRPLTEFPDRNVPRPVATFVRAPVTDPFTGNMNTPVSLGSNSNSVRSERIVRKTTVHRR